MGASIELYTTPSAMEPLFPIDRSGRLEELAMELIRKASNLSNSLHPITRKAIADFLRPMNSYYSNLIEGHDTHPIDIEKILKQDFSEDTLNRDLQMEAHAHIMLHEWLSNAFEAGEIEDIPCSPDFIKMIHREFYTYLPNTFKEMETDGRKTMRIIPGAFRTNEVEVGRHVGPAASSLDSFINRFAEFYDPTSNSNSNQIRRIISIAASHHRLAWIHPFMDVNGRVMRLFSDSCFMYEGLASGGLWSISRGLARTHKTYRAKLANADMKRHGDYDGRGNLSNKMLVEFCVYFLETAIDQINFMHEVLGIERMMKRLEGFADLMAIKKVLRPEAKHILVDVFVKGKITKADAMRITNTSDKTLKNTTDLLEEMGLLKSIREGKEMTYHARYPITLSPMIFPGLYPMDKEIDMMNLF